MTEDHPDRDDVLAAVEVVARAVEPVTDSDDLWDKPAGTLRWSCRHTLAHTGDCLTWYAANLARHSTGPIEVAEMPDDVEPARLLDALRSGAALLASVVVAAQPEDRAFHPFGIADRSGFAAMGCDELLVHGYDLADGLGVLYKPPAELSRHVLRRLFPWAPTDTDPWATLLWANGRTPLGNRPPETEWLWHCAPLTEWDGHIRRRRKT